MSGKPRNSPVIGRSPRRDPSDLVIDPGWSSGRIAATLGSRTRSLGRNPDPRALLVVRALRGVALPPTADGNTEFETWSETGREALGRREFDGALVVAIAGAVVGLLPPPLLPFAPICGRGDYGVGQRSALHT